MAKRTPSQVLFEKFTGLLRIPVDNRFVFEPFPAALRSNDHSGRWEQHLQSANRSAMRALWDGDTVPVSGIVLDRLHVLRNQLADGFDAGAAVGVDVLSAACHFPVHCEVSAAMIEPQRVSQHRGNDDLLTAGLGEQGLRSLLAPRFADPASPSTAELRRRAIWNSWRGIADLSVGGGYGRIYGDLRAVPGREYAALARLPGARQPHRVLAQVPDGFDTARRCLLVAASSGSRGIYAAIAVAAAWGLPRGCAVAYTDKGTGSDYVDLDAATGVREDGSIGRLGEHDDFAFAPTLPAGASGVAYKHAHSQDNPEADWGRHLRQAAEFGLAALDRAFPQAAPFRFDNTRVIAVGISNGGAAALRAAEDQDNWLDAVVAGAPNIYAAGQAGARSLYDYGTEAALLMPPALLALPAVQLLPAELLAPAAPLWSAATAALQQTGLLDGGMLTAQARSAYAQLHDAGWSDAALLAGSCSVGLDLWRAMAVTYASAYGRYGIDAHPGGFRFAVQQPDFTTRPATASERAAWLADAGGIAPGSGVGLIDPALVPPAFTLPGLQRLRALFCGEDEAARRVRAGIAAVRAGLPRAGLPVIVVHGLDDGLIPAAFSSTPYVAAAHAAARPLCYWRLHNVQHFDGLLGLPGLGARYAPLLAYVYEALERVTAWLDGRRRMPHDAVIHTRGRGPGKVTAAQLPMPR
jgi:hydroxybutyrate-dimer hydrolase